MGRKELFAFALGAIVATPGALSALETSADDYSALLDRHQAGDWREIEREDRGVNEEALAEGARIFSVYRLSDGAKVWIITEADRSSTGILLPEEY
ncbi:MAG TPA: hypothetical protein VHG32_27500 [Thermoanaerobaculia bacterium]|nr:hypothetical protein [Thermoanaerobaculia bacterium]